MISVNDMLSPGVFIDEIDLSTYVAIMDSSKVFGIITVAQSGPVNEVTDINSKTSYISTFGAPISAGGLASTFILESTQSLKVVRVAGSSLAYRSVTLAGKDAEDAAIANAVIVTPKYKGTLFSEALTATVSAIEGATADKFNLIITKGEGDTAEELVNANFTIVEANATDEYPYLIGDESTDFRFSLGSTTQVVAKLNPVTGAAFSAGDNGLTFTDAQIQDAIAQFNDPENIDLDIVAAPGITTPACQLALINLCGGKDADNKNTGRMDCFAVLDPPQGLTPQETADYVDGTNTSYPITKLDSSYAGIYSPWGKVFNAYSGAYEWAPPSVGVLPAMAAEYKEYWNWTPPAGIPRMEITVFTELERILKRPDRDILYQSHVNPLCNYKMQGLTAFGQKTLQRKKSSLDRINVRFAVNYVKKLADFSTTKYLFMNIDDNTFNMWTGDIGEQLNSMKLNGGLFDFKVKMDWETVTDEYYNNNAMPGIIQIKPTKTAEFIPIDVVIRNRSDEFE